MRLKWKYQGSKWSQILPSVILHASFILTSLSFSTLTLNALSPRRSDQYCFKAAEDKVTQRCVGTPVLTYSRSLIQTHHSATLTSGVKSPAYSRTSATCRLIRNWRYIIAEVCGGVLLCLIHMFLYWLLKSVKLGKSHKGYNFRLKGFLPLYPKGWFILNSILRLQCINFPSVSHGVLTVPIYNCDNIQNAMCALEKKNER